MKLTEFLDDRQEAWDRLESLLEQAGRRPERLSPEQIRELASGYRAAAADLALARRRFPADPVLDRLETLVNRGRGLIYERAARRANLLDVFVDRYWTLLAERSRPLLLAVALLVVPGALCGSWALVDPETVGATMPVEFLWVTQAETTDQGLGTAGLAGFSTFVFTNNIRVALTAFALGVTWGVGTALLVSYNGFLFGGLTGLAVQAGNTDLFLAAVMAHGVLELTCIVVGAGAGLSMGRAVLRPGTRTRRSALLDEAPKALTIAAATIPWLVVAGLVEGYVSRVGLGPAPTTAVGLALGAAFWSLYVWRGWLPYRRARRLAER